MKLSKMKLKLTGLSMFAVMGVSLFSAGADVLTVKAAEAVTPEETVIVTEAATTEETTVAEDAVTTSEVTTETEYAEEIRVEAGAEVAIDATNFPDDTFREYVIQFDTDENGSFSSNELQAVWGIDVGVSYSESGDIEPGDITNLKGIEYFNALLFLNCNGNQLTSLDVSKNTTLTSLYCGSNQLTSLDVSNNTILTDLYCIENQLTSLDVSNNTALETLWCWGNKLTSLDVSKNTALTELNCDFNQLTSLDISNNTALTSLTCYDNELTSLDVSKNIALTSLDCTGNQLTSLDVSKNTALTELLCDNNELTNLDVSNNTTLTSLTCWDNELTSLDVSKNTALVDLGCGGNELTSLDVSKNTALEALWCEENELTSLDVSRNTALENLSCEKNRISSRSLDVSNNKLHVLTCDSDTLTSLDVCTDLEEVLLYAPLYKKENSCYFDLSKSSLDKTKISSPEIGEYDSASGRLTVPESILVEGKWGYYGYDNISYDFSSGKKQISLWISEVINLDRFAEYQGYSFFKDENGDTYCLDSNGNKVINDFKCDGTYTYYFQADGTAMTDRLTYHPDGKHVIYFDEEGHEVFSNFHEVKKTIAGDAVDDLCFFDVYGHLYVDVMTYGNDAFGNGDKIYYINPYGVIERNGWFGFSATCVWAGTDKKVGTGIGYANSDGSLMINQNTYYEGNLVYMQGDGHMK